MTGAIGNLVAAGLLSHIVVTRFVYCGCGYSEEWIESNDDLQKLRGQFGQT